MPVLIKLTEARRERLTRYLSEQFSRATNGRKNRIDLLRSFIARYEAKTKPKNFPFRGASNIHPPYVATFQDSIKARIVNALKAQPDAFIDAAPLTEEELGIPDPETGIQSTWRDVAELFEEYILFEISPAGQVNFIDALDTFIDDVLSLGTGWLFPIWSVEDDWEILTTPGVPKTVTSFDNCRFLAPAAEDVIYPSHYDSMRRIPFWSRRYLNRPSEILARVKPGGFDAAAVREFLSGYTSGDVKVSELDQERMIAEGSMDAAHYSTGEIELAETWMRFVLDPSKGDGEDPGNMYNGRELKIVVDHSYNHPYTIFRIMAWPYMHGKIPAVPGRYIRRRSRMEGMGIPERLESLDEGYATAVNQVLDNGAIANTRIWAAKPDSDAAEALEDIWPNKVIPVDEPGDFKPVQAGEIYPSGFEIINVFRDMGERVIKVTDYNLGRESQVLGKEGTATGTLALLQETGQYHNNTTRDIRVAINEALQMYRDLIVQYKPISRIRQVLGARGEILVAVLTELTPADFAKRVGVSISFSSTAATRELQRQEEQAKFQLKTTYYQQIMALAMLRFGGIDPATGQPTPPASPPISELADQIARDGEVTMRKLLESYGERSQISKLPNWDKVLNVFNQWQQQIQQAQQLAALTGADPAGANGEGAPGAVGAGGASSSSGVSAPNGGAGPPGI